MKTYLRYLFVLTIVLSVIIIALAAPKTHAAPPEPVIPQAVPENGFGVDFNWGYIRQDGTVDVAIYARNFTGQGLDEVTVRFEVNGKEVSENFDLAGEKKFIREKFKPSLPPLGQATLVSVTMCVADDCAAPTRRKLNDEREQDQGTTLSTRLRYGQCRIQLMVEQDPDFVLKTKDGDVVASGHLGAGEWSPWFDLTPWATHPASLLELKLEADWVGHTPVEEYLTVPATHMGCLPPVKPVCTGLIGTPTNGKIPYEFSINNLTLDDPDNQVVAYQVNWSDGISQLVDDPVNWQKRITLTGTYTVDVNLVTKDFGILDDTACAAHTQAVERPTFNPEAVDCQGAENHLDEPLTLHPDWAAGSITLPPGGAIQWIDLDEGSPPADTETSVDVEFSDGTISTVPLGVCHTTPPPVVSTCTLSTSQDDLGQTWINLGAIDENGQTMEIDQFKADSNFTYHYPPTPVEALPVSLQWPGSRQGSWFVQFSVSADGGETWTGGDSCRLAEERQPPTAGQYQDFIGAVPFGTFTPELEPSKEYFDMAQSIMVNVEYFRNGNQAEVVFRFNGQELDGVTTSIFWAGTFTQIESVAGRAISHFNNGDSQLIAYRFGKEQARMFNDNYNYPLMTIRNAH